MCLSMCLVLSSKWKIRRFKREYAEVVYFGIFLPGEEG